MRKYILPILMMSLLYWSCEEEVAEEVPPASFIEDGFYFVGSFNGHNYYISDEGGDYLNGKLSCELLGGNLVTITSQEENTKYLLLSPR